MNKIESENLINSYLAAETSLDDEERLFKARIRTPEIEAWSTYVQANRKKAPDHLKSAILATLYARKRKEQRMLFSITGIAASVVLALAFFIYSSGNRTLDYTEKEALLKEALSMFPEDNHKPTTRNIIYQDEMIVIYLTSN